jgi:hypothetical protein
MGIISVSLPEELTEPVERKASELKVDVARFVAAVIREKLKMPVAIGDLEVFVPADIGEFEMERAVGESDEDFESTKEMYGALFTAALK